MELRCEDCSGCEALDGFDGLEVLVDLPVVHPSVECHAVLDGGPHGLLGDGQAVGVGELDGILFSIDHEGDVGDVDGLGDELQSRLGDHDGGPEGVDGLGRVVGDPIDELLALLGLVECCDIVRSEDRDGAVLSDGHRQDGVTHHIGDGAGCGLGVGVLADEDPGEGCREDDGSQDNGRFR